MIAGTAVLAVDIASSGLPKDNNEAAEILNAVSMALAKNNFAAAKTAPLNMG